MQKDFKERLIYLLKALKTNASGLARELGYKSPEKIGRLIREGDKVKHPSYELLCDIANKFEFINIRWLLTGSGEAFNKESAGGILVLEEDKEKTKYGTSDKGKSKEAKSTSWPVEMHKIVNDLHAANKKIENLESENRKLSGDLHEMRKEIKELLKAMKNTG